MDTAAAATAEKLLWIAALDHGVSFMKCCDENDDDDDDGDDDDRFLRPTRILGQSMIARRRFPSALQEILNATRTVGPQ
jgi:hypothetical protein